MTAPNACALCGVERREHAQHYGGAHLGDRPKGYVEPTLAQLAERLRARLAAQAWARLRTPKDPAAE